MYIFKKTQGLDDLVCDVCLDSSGYEFDDLIVCCLCNR